MVQLIWITDSNIMKNKTPVNRSVRYISLFFLVVNKLSDEKKQSRARYYSSDTAENMSIRNQINRSIDVTFSVANDLAFPLLVWKKRHWNFWLFSVDRMLSSEKRNVWLGNILELLYSCLSIYFLNFWLKSFLEVPHWFVYDLLYINMIIFIG